MNFQLLFVIAVFFLGALKCDAWTVSRPEDEKKNIEILRGKILV